MQQTHVDRLPTYRQEIIDQRPPQASWSLRSGIFAR
jgi:hypothetical protein